MDQEERTQLPKDFLKGLLKNVCSSPKSVADPNATPGENDDSRNTIIRDLATDFLRRVIEKTIIMKRHFCSMEIHKIDVDIALEYFAKEELEVMPHYMTDDEEEEEEEEEEYNDDEEEELEDDKPNEYPIKLQKVYGIYNAENEPYCDDYIESALDEEYSDDEWYDDDDEGPIISRDFGMEPTRLFDGLYRPEKSSDGDSDFYKIAREIVIQDFKTDPPWEDEAFDRLYSAMKAYLVYKLKGL